MHKKKKHKTYTHKQKKTNQPTKQLKKKNLSQLCLQSQELIWLLSSAKIMQFEEFYMFGMPDK